MRTARKTFAEAALTYAAIFVFASLVYLGPRWGIPLHTDVTWIYRLQTAQLPELAANVPEGFRAFGAVPSAPLAACLAFYEATGRVNCVDSLLFRATAGLASADADAWRLSFILFNAAAVMLFVMACRALSVPGTLTLFLTVGLVLSPREVWGEYTSSEPKATLFLLLAVVVALHTRSALGAAGSALAMVLAYFSKEPVAVTWPVAVAATLYANVATLGAAPAEMRRAALLVLPHAVAALSVAVFTFGLRVVHPPESDYALAVTGSPLPLLDFTRAFLSALQPGLIRGNVVAVSVASAVVIAAAFAFETAARGNLARAVTRRGVAILIALCLGIALHAAVYYVTRRYVGDSRYLLPANYLFALALGVVSAAFASSLPRRWLRPLEVAAAGALVLGFILQTGGNELTVSALGLAAVATAGVGFLSAIREAQPLRRAAIAGLLVMQLVPALDASLDEAETVRRNLEQWRGLTVRVSEEALPGAHVILRFREPYMVEHAYALEAYTLLRGRFDITYHLEVEDTSGFATDSGFLRATVEAFNRGRASPPTTERAILVVRAERLGTQADRSERRQGLDAIRVWLQSPTDFYVNRYRQGKAGYLRYEITDASR